MKSLYVKSLALILIATVSPLTHTLASTSVKDQAALTTKELSKKIINELKNSVVSIKIHETEAAFKKPISSCGTGFVVDLEKGILVTNRHIASVDTPASYEIEFYDGTILEADFIWNHPTKDFAFLKVDPKKIPASVKQVHFAQAQPGERITIIGNNQAQGHSVQTGEMIDLFSIVDPTFPNHSFSMSLNTRGGSSGSPVFNHQGAVIALNNAGNDTTAYAVPIQYVTDALRDVAQQKTPKYIATGAVFQHMALDKLALYYKYPHQKAMNDFLKTIPDSRNRVLCVDSVLPGTPAASLLEPGDIIEAVNGKSVGPDLYKMENLMPKNAAEEVKFTVIRNGKILEISVPTIDLNENQCTTFAKIGNAIFATITPVESYVTGMPMGSVCVMTNTAGSLFEQLPLTNRFGERGPQVRFTKVDGRRIKTLSDFIQVIPGALAAKHFTYHIQDYGFAMMSTNTCKTHQNELSQYAKHDPEHYDAPVIVSFNPQTYKWERKPLSAAKTVAVASLDPLAKKKV